MAAAFALSLQKVRLRIKVQQSDVPVVEVYIVVPFRFSEMVKSRERVLFSLHSL